uniref:Sigma 54 modulation/S30EA ribosomal protein C-terminal domain-containing protein n=1 Tax=Compsopogon caeruleus TaxID=31354 RepID=A0A6T6D553_9RHOD|mmetsp:Transcript_581/g.1153  ORF Transcript_581/g.1153 Transcript_581/m.1153 type:complete len:260 (+) Transcript_581:307-1086(+)
MMMVGFVGNFGGVGVGGVGEGQRCGVKGGGLVVGRRDVGRARGWVSMDATSRFHVTGNNIELTQSLKEYVYDKVGKSVSHYGSIVKRVDVHLSVSHNASIKNGHAAEVVVSVPGGQTLRAEVKSEGMYASLDLVSDKVSRILRKFKERTRARKGGSRTADVAGADENSEEQLSVDEVEDDVAVGAPPLFDENGVPIINQVVKHKVFPMPPTTLEEATLLLDYMDHDFYVFRNAETKEVNVVYKRKHGGVGHIQPQPYEN